MEKIVILKNFLENNMNNINEIQYELDFIPLFGLSNLNYLVKVINKKSKTLLKELFYKSFGEISELVDRDTEREIIDCLSSKNLTPVIFETDNATYRIEEYIENSDVLPRNLIKEDFIIEKIFDILIEYSKITPICSFTIVPEEFRISYGFPFQQLNKKNFFDKCLYLMYEKAKTNFEKFNFELSENSHSFLKEEEITKINKIKHYMENYKDLLIKVFPKKGIFSLCHNDLHRLNILLNKETQKLIIIDHEFACMNLPGFDIVNYMIGTKFDYTIKVFPFYEFKEEMTENDFAENYQVFLKFMKKFEIEHSIDTYNESFSLFQKCKKPKYFYRIVCLVCLLWIIIIIKNLNYEDLNQKNKYDRLSNGIDLIFIFEKAYFILQNLNY